MHKLMLSSWVLWIFLLGCQEETFQPLPYATVKEVLREFHFADAAAERFEGKQKPRNLLRSELYDQILDRFQLDRETFYQSYYYYLTDSYLLDSMYTQLIDSLDLVVHDLEKYNIENRGGSPANRVNFSKPDSTDPRNKPKVPVWQQGPPEDPDE